MIIGQIAHFEFSCAHARLLSPFFVHFQYRIEI